MISLTEPLRLAPDVQITPVSELPTEIRERISTDTLGHSVSRTAGRALSRVVDDESRALLECFAEPTLLVEAIASFSADHGMEPHQALNDALPLFIELVQDGVLIGQSDSFQSEQLLSVGEIVLGARVDSRVYSMDDTEVYRGSLEGAQVAIKVARTDDPRIGDGFERERSVLTHLNGTAAPDLLATGVTQGRPVLITSWVEGAMLAKHMVTLRLLDPAGFIDVCTSVASAYAELHAAGILHGDVHSGNIMISPDGSATLIDFGQAAVPGKPIYHAGIAAYYEPEYASAVLANRSFARTALGEQYALATVLLECALGHHPIELPFEAADSAEAIIDHDPLTVRPSWLPRQLAAVLAQARAVQPEGRYLDCGELADALQTIEVVGPEASMVTDLVAEAIQMMEPGRADEIELPQTAPRSSIYYGGAGVAYGLLVLAELTGSASLLDRSRLWATMSVACDDTDAYVAEDYTLTAERVQQQSLYHGRLGSLTVLGLIGSAQGDRHLFERSVDDVLSIDSGTDDLDPMMGAASSIRALVALADSPMANSDSKADLRRHAAGLTNRLWRALRDQPPIMEIDGVYLGAAHGWAGNLGALLRSKELGIGDFSVDGLFARLDELADLATVSEGAAWWPATLTKDHGASAAMGAWCNGSAGFVPMFCAAYRLTKTARYLELAEGAARAAVGERSAVHNICCGSAGKALAILELHRTTGEQYWLDCARSLTAEGRALRDEGSSLIDDLAAVPLSIYKGDLGLAVAAAAVESPDHEVRLLV